MKIFSLVLASISSTVALPVAQSSNVSAPSIPVPSNVSQPDPFQRLVCRQPVLAFGEWYYNTYSKGPYLCYGEVNESWMMLNSYRSGGIENVHWKYTDDPNDGECLSDWLYYDKDGTKVIAFPIGRTTFAGDTRRWCALPVYRSGGVELYQWGYCTCRD